MNSLQEQVSVLTSKVDALHQVMDQINARVTEALAAEKLVRVEGGHPAVVGASLSARLPAGYGGLDRVMEHKDVLVDNLYFDAERSGGEKELSPEIQIQRLTAQLTAAYNRIAALEEQLLATRSHH